MTSNQMTVISDVTPIFTTDTAAPPGNVAPVLARRKKLTNENEPIMLKGITFGGLPLFAPIGIAHG